MPTLLWEHEINGCKLAVVQGDITSEPVDAIVNAANDRLLMGAGVAGAIRAAGGDAIQSECDAWVKIHGLVKVGGAVVTGAGKLPHKCVIHAVGPIWGTGNEVANLASAVEESLRLADERGLLSISFPAVSSGVFGFPKVLCATTFFDTVEEWLEENPQRSLKSIRFCNFDEETAGIFHKEATSRYK
jgi:O-acetyl-ADP-ribose deacetylase